MVVRHGTETKTRHCQPLHHRNRHPPRETLNHFYCIELSLLPAERTSKRVFSLSLFHTHPLSLPPPPGGYLFPPRAPFARSFPALVLRPRLPAGYALFPFLPPRLPRLRRPGREIIRTRKRSHPFGCPNGISSLIRGFTAGQTNRPRAVAEIIFGGRKRAASWPNFSFAACPSQRSRYLLKVKRVLGSVKFLRVHLKYLKRHLTCQAKFNIYQVTNEISVKESLLVCFENN